jgi:D-alanyl-D-alanine carboxypeptidase
MMKKRFVIVTSLAVAIAGSAYVNIFADSSDKSDNVKPSPTAESSSSTNPSSSEPTLPAVTPDPTDAATPTESKAPFESENPPEPEPSKSAKPPVSETPDKDDTPPAESSSELAASLVANLPSDNFKINKNGIMVVTNSSSILAVVNKKRNLPSTYAPDDLVIPDVPFSFSGNSPKKQMRKEAAAALENLFAAAKKDGIQLKAVSGYRSYATQKALFQSNADLKGEEDANRTSARPGQSEHQTGLAMDVSSASANYELEPEFGDTKEGKWLAQHAYEHGFIIRFLKGKEDITGYSYEPWHVRYVGKAAAKGITKQNVTLEEYFDAFAASLDKEVK